MPTYDLNVLGRFPELSTACRHGMCHLTIQRNSYDDPIFHSYVPESGIVTLHLSQTEIEGLNQGFTFINLTISEGRSEPGELVLLKKLTGFILPAVVSSPSSA